MHRMGRLSCWRKIEDFKTRERKRNKRLAELDGLVPLVEPKRNRVVAAIVDVLDRIHEFSLKNLGVTWRKLSRGAYLIGMYTDQHGEVVKLFRDLQIIEDDQLSWLEFWEELDDDGNNKMQYSEFLDTFQLENNLYTRRFYDLINTSLTGYLSFKEFISSTWAFLVFDQQETLRLAFRLMSRLGVDFKQDKSVLDVADLRDFVEFRYPELEPRAQLQRARVLYSYICSKTAPPLEDYRSRRDRGIDFNTWCVYCFEDEPLLMVYACTLQHLMRQRLFGDAHWMGLTRARSHMYTYDVVLSRRIKHVVHNQLTAVKEDRAPNFNKDFPTLARKFKDNHSQKTTRENEAKTTTWLQAQETRDRIVRLLENLEGDRRHLYWNFKKWRRNVGMGAKKDAVAVTSRPTTAERNQPATPVKPRARRSFFDFGWGAKNKVNVADEGSKQDLTAETKSNDSQERPDTAAERREKLRQASRLRLTTKDAIVNDDNTADGERETDDELRGSMAIRRVSSRQSGRDMKEAMKYDVYRKILEREERSQMKQGELLNQYVEDWMQDAHKTAKPDITLSEINYNKNLLLKQEDNLFYGTRDLQW